VDWLSYCSIYVNCLVFSKVHQPNLDLGCSLLRFSDHTLLATHTQKHTHTHTHRNTHTYHTRTRTHAHARTHTHTHTHTGRTPQNECTESATLTTHKKQKGENSCPKQDSNPLPQHSSSLKPEPWTAGS